MESKVISVAENGVAVTEEMVQTWCEAYEAGEIPEGYDEASPVVQGRPKLFEGEMTSVTIRIPVQEKSALQQEAASQGVSMSVYLRGILEGREVMAAAA